jgi:hypothetical protein
MRFLAIPIIGKEGNSLLPYLVNCTKEFSLNDVVGILPKIQGIQMVLFKAIDWSESSHRSTRFCSSAGKLDKVWIQVKIEQVALSSPHFEEPVLIPLRYVMISDSKVTHSRIVSLHT